MTPEQFLESLDTEKKRHHKAMERIEFWHRMRMLLIVVVVLLAVFGPML